MVPNRIMSKCTICELVNFYFALKKPPKPMKVVDLLFYVCLNPGIVKFYGWGFFLDTSIFRQQHS